MNLQQNIIGPYKVLDSNLVMQENGDIFRPINQPSILFDKETLTLHKLGSKAIVEKRYKLMVFRLSSMDNETQKLLLNDLLLVTFDLDVFSAKELATLFNAAYHCTGATILKYIAANDLAAIKSEIKRLADAGY